MGSSRWNAEEGAMGTIIHGMDSEARKHRKAPSSVGEREPIIILNWRVTLVL